MPLKFEPKLPAGTSDERWFEKGSSLYLCNLKGRIAGGVVGVAAYEVRYRKSLMKNIEEWASFWSVTGNVVAIILCCALLSVRTARADDDESKSVDLQFSSSYLSQYMWRGYDLFPNDDAGVSFDLSVSSVDYPIYLGSWFVTSLSKENHKWDELDLYLGLADSVLNDVCKLDLDLSYTYFYFPKQGRDIDTHEIALKGSLPELLSFEYLRVIPYGGIYYGWPNHSGPRETWWGQVGLALESSIANPLGGSEIGLRLYGESFHNDGGGSFASAPGFGYVEFGLKAEIPINDRISLDPKVASVISNEDSVNDEDEIWAEVKLSFALY